MVLKPNEVRLFEYMRLYFKWIPWELPFQWNTNYTQIHHSRSKWKCMPFCINTFLIFAGGLLSIFVVIFRSSLFPQVATPQAATLGIVFALTTPVAAVSVLILTSDTIWFAINETLGLCDRILHCQGRHRKSIVVDKILHLFMCVITVLPLSIPLACVLSDIDALYVLLDTCVLPNILYRSIAVSAAQGLFRFILYMNLAADMSRGFGLLITLFFILFDRQNELQTYFQKKWTHSHRFAREYRNNYVAWVCIVGKDSRKLLYIAFYALFWLIVGSVWVVVTNSPEAVSYMVYACMAMLASFGILMFVVVSHLICEILHKSQNSITAQQFLADYRYAKNPSKEKRIRILVLRSFLPVQMYYGSFQCINREFVVDFLWNIVMRTLDAILLTYNN